MLTNQHAHLNLRYIKLMLLTFEIKQHCVYLNKHNFTNGYRTKVSKHRFSRTWQILTCIIRIFVKFELSSRSFEISMENHGRHYIFF